MPVIVLGISLDDVGVLAVEQARVSSQRVIDLVESDLKPGETITGRLKEIAREAMKLAQTYQAIEVIMSASAEDSRSDDSSNARPGSQGCAPQEGDPSVN